MKREIDFTAYDKKRNVLIPNVTLSTLCDQILFHETVAKEVYGDNYEEILEDNYQGNEWYLLHEDFEIMQYVGKKDRKGNRIYEGSILKSDDGYYVKVWYDADGAAFIIGTSEWDCWLHNLELGKYELAGNIHQHANLLTH